MLSQHVKPLFSKARKQSITIDTCGGISLESIDIKTMQSKTSKDLYFAGEVLNIDGITGGYNFQSAWSTGYIAGKLGN